MTGTNIKRLYILDYGLFQVHANGRIIGIMGYLIQTQDGRNILVDTGFPAKYVDDVEHATKEDRLDAFGRVVSLTANNLPAAQLALIGLSPADIDVLIMTHTHIDHVGGIADFPQAPIIISQVERALDYPLYWGDVHPISWPEDAAYQLIEDDTEFCSGLSIFFTPGHAPGQLSLLVTLPQTGKILLTSDAISRPAEIDEAFDTARDPAQAIASANKLMAIAKRENALIIYGHDPAQWETLRKTPYCYE
ncbi:MAG: N-acyl homoserine lactonase family protein [Chloroflexota bacterium]